MESVRAEEIKGIADSTRANMSTSTYGINDLFKECNSMGYKHIRRPINSKDMGFVMLKCGDTIIYTNSAVRLSREYFTLAHEIGHAKLHITDNQSILDTISTIASSVDELEIEANYFAACLLMPEELVKKYITERLMVEEGSLSALDIARIMSEFKVSFDTVLNRLENLKIIDNVQRSLIDCDKQKQKVTNLLEKVGGDSRLNQVTREIVMSPEYYECAIANYNNSVIPIETVERVLSYYGITLEDIEDKIKRH